MRFLAAFGVMLYHYSPALRATVFAPMTQATQFGYLGVPLFFIISGFVISGSAQSRSPYEVAISRFVRLYPAYWTGLLITIAVVSLLGTGTFSIGQVLANLTMLNDYVHVPSIDSVYWTLHVELKFYACVFLLCLFGVFTRYRIWLTIWTAITASYLVFGQPFFLGWFISPFYSSYFIAGVAFFLWLRDGPGAYLATILAASLVLSSAYAFQQVSGFVEAPTLADRWSAVAIVWSFFAFFWLLVHGRLRIRGGPFVLALGGMTYPLYLIHARAGKDLIAELSETYSVLLSVALVSITMLALSLAVHMLVERRIATRVKVLLLEALPDWARSGAALGTTPPGLGVVNPSSRPD
jgi:peptidoglycan/LPS O-acetylase OafA/YrhL